MTRNVRHVQFSTPDPFDHGPRALDGLRRMGMTLLSFRIGPDEEGFRVDLDYVPKADHLAAVFEQRIAQMRGVSGLLATRARYNPLTEDRPWTSMMNGQL